MAQNVTIAGASYADVPAVNLPKTGGGTATFYDADSLPDFTGADGTNPGTHGLVPAPAATDNGKFLRGDGTWASAVEMTVLWENASPTSSFSGQTVTLSQNAGIFDLILIKYNLWAATEYYEDLNEYNYIWTMNNSSGQLQTWTGESNNRVGRRKFYISGTTGKFDTAYYNGSSNNNGQIPIRIYGINL